MRNPCPAPVRLPDPAARTIGRPIAGDSWRPHPAILRDGHPSSRCIEVFASNVIPVRIIPRLSVTDYGVTFIVPGIPTVHRRRATQYVSRVIRGTADRLGFTHLHTGGALGSRDLRRAGPHDHLRIKTTYLDTIDALLRCGTYGGIRCVDFNFCLGFLEDGVICISLSDLELNLRAPGLG